MLEIDRRWQPAVVHLMRCFVPKRLMWSSGVVEIEVPGYPLHHMLHPLIFVEVDLFVLQRSPKPFDEDVVKSPASGVHADPDPMADQFPGKCHTRVLRALVGVEYLGRTLHQSLLKRFQAEVDIHRIG